MKRLLATVLSSLLLLSCLVSCAPTGGRQETDAVRESSVTPDENRGTVDCGAYGTYTFESTISSSTDVFTGKLLSERRGTNILANPEDSEAYMKCDYIEYTFEVTGIISTVEGYEPQVIKAFVPDAPTDTYNPIDTCIFVSDCEYLLPLYRYDYVDTKYELFCLNGDMLLCLDGTSGIQATVCGRPLTDAKGTDYNGEFDKEKTLAYVRELAGRIKHERSCCASDDVKAIYDFSSVICSVKVGELVEQKRNEVRNADIYSVTVTKVLRGNVLNSELLVMFIGDTVQSGGEYTIALNKRIFHKAGTLYMLSSKSAVFEGERLTELLALCAEETLNKSELI